MIRNPKSIIKELERLVEQEKIPVSGLFAYEPEFKYEPINHYIKSIFYNSKPETASHELFRDLVKDVLNTETISEVNIGDGFVDFALKESKNRVGNPVLIEIKPLFKLIKSKEILKYEPLVYTDHKEQIQKYLKKNEYVILTNMKDAFLFSRNAIINFEPFSHLAFPEILITFLEYQNFWDTIRRIEDQQVKIDLDKSFFADLKNWYKEFQDVEMIENDKFSKEELIVLLLNKIIFIRTLDDLGLVQFNHIIEEYLDKKDKWGAKGSERILTRFFNELEEFFNYFYDTELFKEKFWDYVVKDKANTDKFLHIFETTLGLDAWNKAFGKGMLHYNYRWIDEDVFGKAYETFIAENKKDSGIFYTPKEITTYMAKKLVDYLFEPIVEQILQAVDKDVTDYETADKLLKQLYEIKIIDTASGSGSFLIKILREIYNYYLKIDKSVEWIKSITGDNLFDLPGNIKETREFRTRHNFDNHLQLISKIILRHIYAADIDERALETAKTNIWKEAIKLEPLIYNYRKLNGESSHILPNLELNFINGDSLADLPISQQLEIIGSEHKNEVVKLFEIRNDYLNNPNHPERIEEAIEIKKKVFNRLKTELPEIDNPILITLEYFFAYFDQNGKALDENERGFHGVIGNPPWEAIKPVEKEFAGKGKSELDILSFQKWFADKLKNDTEWAASWDKYVEFYENYKAYLSQRYRYQSVGDPNYYKLFLERDFELLRKDGMINLLIPSGIQTDKGCSELRDFIINRVLLHELVSFENRGYKRIVNGEEKIIRLFPDVDSRFKFTIVNATNQPAHPFNSFEAKFYMLDPDELTERTPVNYNLEMVQKFSPENLSIMEFKTERDYELCKKIRNEHKLFGEYECQLHSEFHMTNDSHLFHKDEEIEKKKDEKKVLPLYEGKMIHQYNSNYSEIRYFVYEKEAKEQMRGTEMRNIKRSLDLKDEEVSEFTPKLEYENYRVAYRAIGRSTDERTLIASIVPSKTFLGNSLNYVRNNSYKKVKGKVVQNKVNLDEMIVLMTLFNSLCVNYYIRNKISANLNMFFIYELPIPKLNKKQKELLVNSGLALLSHFNEKKQFNKLFEEMNFIPPKKFDSIKTRAELELFIAKDVYGLNDEDWEYITSTFTYGSDSQTKKELDQIIAHSLKK
ncbi:MAG: N-6 DNA methylase [bacterium]